MSYFDDAGTITEIEEADIFFDDPPEQEPAPIPLDARLMASRFITVTLWAGADPARLAIVAKLLRLDDRCQAHIGRDHHISEDRINRAIAEGRDFLRGIQSGEFKQVTKKRRGKRLSNK
jgi:hypothetical protein